MFFYLKGESFSLAMWLYTTLSIIPGTHLFKKEAILPSVVNTKSLFRLKVALSMATATSSEVIILVSSLGDSDWVEPSASKAFFLILEAVKPGQATKTWTPCFITSVLKDSKKPFMAYLLGVGRSGRCTPEAVDRRDGNDSAFVFQDLI